MARLPDVELRKRILEEVESGKKSVAQVAREYGISRVTFYKWTKRDNLAPDKTGPKTVRVIPEKVQQQIVQLAQRFPKSSKYAIQRKLEGMGSQVGVHGVYNILAKQGLSRPEERETRARGKKWELGEEGRRQVKEMMSSGQMSVAQVARQYGISRVTLYKWLRREGVTSHKPGPKFGQGRIQAELASKIVAIARSNPGWSKYAIAEQLGAGVHGVYNTLVRNNLNTVQARYAYATTSGSMVMGGRPSIEISAGGWSWDWVGWGVVAMIGSAIGSTLTVYWLRWILASGINVGGVVASVALGMGTIFLVYSVKYYFSIVLVLSFSQGGLGLSLEFEREGETKKLGWLQWLMGQVNDVRRTRFLGMDANVDKVTIQQYPMVSIQIPLYNEKNVAKRAIAAAVAMDYPEYEVIVADDSTDGTSQIIAEYMQRFGSAAQSIVHNAQYTLTQVEVRPGVVLKHLHRKERTGYKGGALALALEYTNPKSQFISVLDADFVPYQDLLTTFVKYFKIANNGTENYKATNIAAVQGYQWHVLNKSESWITRGVRTEYSGSYVIERAATELYGGLRQISGSVYMIRREVLEQVGWGGSITEDFELTLRLYAAGYKVVYTPYVQAPAECVSTVKRLIRQRMRWAEGHSFNIRRMLMSLMTNDQVTMTEKMELLYLAPYYLQAAFFLVGSLAWMISEVVFRTTLPFWSSLWGWSLVLTNMLALPLMNGVGLFLEEGDRKDYVGLASFVVMSYLVVPFQAYAAIKGFVEKEEGPWFRTPKTGRITDVLTRSAFYRFIRGMLPGRLVPVELHLGSWPTVPKIRHGRWGNVVVTSMVLLAIGIHMLSNLVPLAQAAANETNLATVGQPSQENVQAKLMTQSISRVRPAKAGEVQEIFHLEPRMELKQGRHRLETVVVGSNLGPAQHNKAYQKGTEVQYEQVFDGVDVRYQDQGMGLAEGLVINKPMDLQSVSYIVRMEGLTAKGADGTIKWVDDQTGQSVFTAGAPYLYEANGEALVPFEQLQKSGVKFSFGVEYDMHQTPLGWELRKTLTAEGKKWLADPQRKFPVVLDPSVIISGGITTAETDYGSLQRKVAFVGSSSNTITHDASTTSFANSTSVTFSHTVANQSNRLLIVGVAIRGAVSVTSATYAGVAMTKIRHDMPGSDVRSELWYLVAPATGANNVVVNVSASQNFVVGASSYYGVHQTDPLGADNGATGSSTNPLVTVSSQIGGMVVDVVARQAVSTLTRGANQTQAWQQDGNAGTGASSYESGTTTVTMDWTMITEAWAISAVALRPAGSWYAVNADDGAINFDRSADGINWDITGVVDNSDTDNFSPSLWVRGNVIYVAWVDDSTDTVEFNTIDTANNDTVGTKVTCNDLGTFTGTNYVTSIAVQATGTDVYVSLSDTSGTPDTEDDIWRVPGTSCAAGQSIKTGSGHTDGVKGVLVTQDDDLVMVFQTGSTLLYSYYKALDSVWEGASTTIAAVADSRYSVTTDGYRVWVLSVSGTTDTNFYQSGGKQTLVDSGVGVNRAGVDINCVGGSTDCKIIFVDPGPAELEFVDCNDAGCTAPTFTALDTDASEAGSMDSSVAMACLSATTCKVVWYDIGSDDISVIECNDATCTSAARLTCAGVTPCDLNTSAGGEWVEGVDIYCVTSTDCDIVYLESDQNDLKLIRCTSASNAVCSTISDGIVDPDVGEHGGWASIYCPTSTDCKIAYYDSNTNGSILVADCNNAPCTSATLDATGTVDSNVGTNGPGYVNIDCAAGATECRVVYYDATDNDVTFWDCNADADCSSGSATDIDTDVGDKGAPVAMYCNNNAGSPDDCKIVYNDSGSATVYFTDCNDDTCSAPTISALDTTTGPDIAWTAVDCSLGVTDCRVVYSSMADRDVVYMDCEDGDCNAPTTTTKLNAAATRDKMGWSQTNMEMVCPSVTNCKIVYDDVLEGDMTFVDCNDATCSSPTVTDINSNIGRIGATATLNCPSSSDCKVVYLDPLASILKFVDCGSEDCSTIDATTSLDTTVGVDSSAALDCQTATDCKVVYNDSRDATRDLTWLDCDDASCSTTGGTRLLDNGTGVQMGQPDIDCSLGVGDCRIVYSDPSLVAGDGVVYIDCASATTCCAATNCATEAKTIDNQVGTNQGQARIDCVGGATDCKIVFWDNTDQDVTFVDCNDAPCDVVGGTGVAPTVTDLDTTVSNMDDNFYGVTLDCVTSTNCKVGYEDGVDGMYRFIDCEDGDCNAATTNYVLLVSQGLSGGAAAMDCGSDPADCKVLLADVSENSRLLFIDCISESCQALTPTAPFTSQTNLTGAAITYDSTNDTLYAHDLMDASNQAYWKSTNASSISWGGQSSYAFTVGSLSEISAPVTAEGVAQIGVVVKQGSNFEFSATPEKWEWLVMSTLMVIGWTARRRYQMSLRV